MSAPAYSIHDHESLACDEDGRRVRFVVDVDQPARQRCYRVRGVYDVAEQSFDELAVTHSWSNDLEETPVTLLSDEAFQQLEGAAREAEVQRRLLVRSIERFVECEPDFLELLHLEAKETVDAIDPR